MHAMKRSKQHDAALARIPELEAELVEVIAEANAAEVALAELRARDPHLDAIERDQRWWTIVFKVGMVVMVVMIVILFMAAISSPVGR